VTVPRFRHVIGQEPVGRWPLAASRSDHTFIVDDDYAHFLAAQVALQFIAFLHPTSMMNRILPRLANATVVPSASRAYA